MHYNSIKWLKNSIKDSTTDKNIVITHHAPSIKSIPLEFKEDAISSAYASDLESFILEYNPHYWIHGHIHQPITYTVGETKIICNPHGYIDEKYNGYNPKLVIDF